MAAKERRALLEWVLHGEYVVHVSTFAHLRKEDLPPVACPVCGEEVVLKRGKKRAHHYAHYPESVCAATAPESAAHLNVKFYLAEVLERSRELYLADRCTHPSASAGEPGDPKCPGSRVVLLAEGWDDVKVERRLGSLQPDLQLVKNGEPMLAIEVHHTNAVSDEKAERLAARGLPWVEVAADTALFRAGGWTPDAPMPVERRHPGEDWICEYHLKAKAHQQVLAEERAQQAKERAAARSTREEQDRWREPYARKAQKRRARRKQKRRRLIEECRTLYWRIVDLYDPSGRMFRRLYRARGWFPDGAVKAKKIWIESVPDASAFLHVLDDPKGWPSWLDLRTHFDKHLEDLRKRGILVDSPMQWLKHEAVPAEDPMQYAVYPGRYRWDAERKCWKRPAELDVTWPCTEGSPGSPPRQWPRWKGKPLGRYEDTYPPWGPHAGPATH